MCRLKLPVFRTCIPKRYASKNRADAPNAIRPAQMPSFKKQANDKATKSTMKPRITLLKAPFLNFVALSSAARRSESVSFLLIRCGLTLCCAIISDVKKFFPQAKQVTMLSPSKRSWEEKSPPQAGQVIAPNPLDSFFVEVALCGSSFL